MENKKKFKLFDFNRDGKGVEKEIIGPKNFKNFFKHYGRKFTKLLSVNLIMIFLVLPIIVAAFVFVMGPTMPSPADELFPVAFSTSVISPSPANDIFLLAHSTQLSVPVYNSYVYYVIGAIGVIYVLTFGWQNVGSTYIMRNLVRGDPVFIISDYFYAIKKNFKQGFILGLIDCLIIGVLFVDFNFFSAQASSYMTDVMYVATIALIIIYIFMRFYTYLQLVTFNLNIWKILKNSFIFTILGVSRNIVALFGIILIAAVNIILGIYSMQINFIIPFVLPLFYFMATCGFITAYAAYPVLEKYMIDDTPAVTESTYGEEELDEKQSNSDIIEEEDNQ